MIGRTPEEDPRVRELEAKVAELEASRRAEAEAEDALRLRSSMAIELLKTVDRLSIFKILAERIHAVADGAIVSVNEYMSRSNTIVGRSLQCTPYDRMRVLSILGRDPEGLTLDFPDAIRQAWTSTQRVQNGLFGLLFGQVPAGVCERLERELALGDIFAMACTYEKDILGTVAIMTRRRGPLRNQKLIEDMVAQAALALKRIRADEARREMELLFENTSDGVVIHTLDGVIREVNDAYGSMSGYARAELTGMPIGALEAEADVAGRIRKVVENGGHDRFETRHRRKDGSFFDVDVTALYLGEEAGRVAIFVRDITDRKQAEEALRESEARFRSLFDNLLDGYAYCQMLFDEEGRPVDFIYLSVNASFERITGLKDVVGRKVSEVIPGIRESVPGLIETYGRVARTGQPERFETYVPSLRIWLTISVYSPHQDHFVAVFDNITDRKNSEVEREKLVEALRETDRRKNEFMALLSHELRNPLAPIANSLYVLEHAVPGGDQALRAQAVIGRQVGQLSRLVDDLLDVTRITERRIQLKRQRLELNDLLRRTIEDHRSMFEKAEVRLELGVAPQPIFVRGDWSRLAQVIGNLLQNAVKFTPRGGRVSVSVSADGNRAVIRVVDTGVGMPPEMIERLFQPFVQADKTLDRSKGGLGLGLALVRGLVELHGGEVAASSAGPGRGSEFVVRLPVESAGASDTGARRAEPVKARRRVLIIEDNLDAAQSLHDLLELEGHEAEVAIDGPAGIAKAREFRPEIVLCDIGLPGMDGYEVARVFRRDDELKGVFLVALSGYALPEDLQRAREAGFDRHLAKPPSLASLEELLAKAPHSGW